MKRFIGVGFFRAVSPKLARRGSATLMDKVQSSRKQEGRVRLLGIFFFASLVTAVPAHAVGTISLSHAEALRIGKKIWQNECNGTIAGLTSWNEGENFASLGIGHFIWYPRDRRGPFEESFPKLVSFVSSRGAKLPKMFLGVGEAAPCPWNSRAEFFRAIQTPGMKQLRQFLANTVDLQAEFMVGRLQQSLGKMLDEAPASERDNVQRQFTRVASTLHGCYALVDYVNFKGEGVLHTERYRGEGWGLLQVLEQMHGTESAAAATREFANSAGAILRRRVQNSPPERREARWLPGWLNRVRSYNE
jgi:hypothetical protein